MRMESWDQQLARLRALVQRGPEDGYDAADLAALGELLRRWDVVRDRAVTSEIEGGRHFYIEDVCGSPSS